MSTNYNVGTVIGFEFSLAEALEPFSTVLPEVFHMEPRYDPLTGQKVKEVKVVDSYKSVTYNIAGVTYEDNDDFAVLDALAIALGCFRALSGELNSYPNDLKVFFTPFQEDSHTSEEFGRFEVNLTKYNPELIESTCDILYEKLVAMGLHPKSKTPVITSYVWWC